MQTVKPKIKRVYVTLKDAETGEIKHVTVYNATPDDVLKKLTGTEKTPRKSEAATSAA
jgi:hypothetical protein